MTIGFNSIDYTVGEAEGEATLFVVLISGELERNVTVMFDTKPGTAGSIQGEPLLFNTGLP